MVASCKTGYLRPWTLKPLVVLVSLSTALSSNGSINITND